MPDITYSSDVQVVAQSWTANHIRIRSFKVDAVQLIASVEAEIGSIDAQGNFSASGIYRYAIDLSSVPAQVANLAQGVATLSMNQGKLPTGGAVA